MNTIEEIQTLIATTLQKLEADLLTAADVRKEMAISWRRVTLPPKHYDFYTPEYWALRKNNYIARTAQHSWDSARLMINLPRGNCCVILFGGSSLAIFLVRYPAPPLLEHPGKEFGLETLKILAEVHGKASPDLVIPPSLREEWLRAFDPPPRD